MQMPAPDFPSPQRDDPSCERPLNCSSPGPCDLISLGAFHDRSGLIGPVEVVRCRNCGLGISRPSIPDVTFLYADRSSQDFQPNTSGLAHFIKTLAFRREARRLLRSLPNRPDHVIDFGCGSGLFTRCLGDELGADRVTGLDFHTQSPGPLADRPYRAMADAQDLHGSADLVLAMHVLEHDDDVSGLLTRIMNFMRPGGRVVIEVPNIDCPWAKVFGAYWDAWYMPYHRSHFSWPSLRAALEAKGLVIEQEIAACVPTMGRTLANLLKQPNSTPLLLAGILLHPLQILRERLSRQPSALRIIARRPA